MLGRVAALVVAWIPACAGMTEGGAGMAGGRRGNDGGGVEAMAGLGAGRGEIPAASAGMTELFGAGVTGLSSRGCEGGGVEAMAGLGAGHGEIPAASAGMTELFARVWRK